MRSSAAIRGSRSDVDPRAGSARAGSGSAIGPGVSRPGRCAGAAFTSCWRARFVGSVGEGGSDLAGAGTEASRGPGGAKGPASCNAMPHAASTLATSSQNRPRPRQPAKNCRGQASTGGSVGDHAVLPCHCLGQRQSLLQLEVSVVGLGRIELRETLWRLGRDLFGDRRQIGPRCGRGIRRAALVLQHMVEIGLALRPEARRLLP